MRFRATIPAGLLSLGIALSVHAMPSIDFVNRDDSLSSYSDAHCVATDAHGQRYAVAAEKHDNVSSVKLARLLAGNAGRYTIECTLVPDRSKEAYISKFDAVKFRSGEPAHGAPEYDENQFGYGIKIPLSQTHSNCYDPNTRLMQPRCLDAFYGTQRYFLEPLSANLNVRFNHSMEYTSNVGVFLKDNPRHLQGQREPRTDRATTSITSPFQ